MQFTIGLQGLALIRLTVSTMARVTCRHMCDKPIKRSTPAIIMSYSKTRLTFLIITIIDNQP